MSFTETNLVPNAGLLPAAALAQRIGLGDLVDRRLRLAAEGGEQRREGAHGGRVDARRG